MARMPRNLDALRPPGHVTIREAGKIAGMVHDTIRRWIKAGRLPATRTHSRSLTWIREPDLEKALKKSRKQRQLRRQPDPNSLSPNEAANMLGVTGEAVKTWIYKGWLKATKQPNGYWRIKHDDLRSYLDSREKLSSKVYMATGNRDLAGTIAAATQNLGAEALLVPDFADALKSFAESPPNLLVVDLDSFPEAWKFIRKVRGTSYYGSPKILLLSMDPLSEKETGDAVRLGINGCLGGEVTDEVLETEMRALLGRGGG